MTEIEDGELLPTHKKFPFAELDVGQSFFVEGEFSKKCAAYMTKVHRWTEKTNSPKRFTMRTVVKNGVVGSRCWRVK